MLRLEAVGEEAGAELGFEPGGLGGHETVGVGDAHEFFHGGGVHRKRYGGACLDSLLQLFGASDASDEVDALVGAGVVDAQEGGEDGVLEAGCSSRASLGL